MYKKWSIKNNECQDLWHLSQCWHSFGTRGGGFLLNKAKFNECHWHSWCKMKAKNICIYGTSANIYIYAVWHSLLKNVKNLLQF